MSLEGPFNPFSDNIEKIHMSMESRQRAIDGSRGQLPQKGLKGWLNRTGKTCQSKQLMKVEADIAKVADLLKQYESIEPKLSKFDAKLLQSLNENLENISTNINALATTRLDVAKKTKGILSRLGFTKSGKELKEAKKAEQEASKNFETILRDPVQVTIDLLKAKSETFEPFKTLSSVQKVHKDLQALEAMSVENRLEKLDGLEMNMRFADHDVSDICFAYFKETASVATSSPDFSALAKEFASILQNSPERLAEPLKEHQSPWRKVDSLINGKPFQGDVTAFMKELVLQMDDPSVLYDSTITRLHSIASQCSFGSEKMAIEALAQAIQEIKLDTLNLVTGELSKERGVVQKVLEETTANTDASYMQAFTGLYNADIPVQNRIGYFDKKYRALFSHEKFAQIAEEFKALKNLPPDQLLTRFCNTEEGVFNFKSALMDCYRETIGASAKKDVITKQVEMGVDEFPKMWKLLILKANDDYFVSEDMIATLQKAYELSLASRKDAVQAAQGMLAPLEGVIQAIRDEISANFS